ATPGDFVAGSGGVPVYLVTMRGHFTVDASTPLGGQAPTGRYASLVLDTRSFDGLDMGLHQNPPPVSPESLGPVTDLLLPPARAGAPGPGPRRAAPAPRHQPLAALGRVPARQPRPTRPARPGAVRPSGPAPGPPTGSVVDHRGRRLAFDSGPEGTLVEPGE